MAIRVVNVKSYNRKEGEVLVKVGRPSPLGNPFYMAHEGMRDEVCEKYESWFAEKVVNSPAVRAELHRILLLARQGDVALGCFCAPRRCHAETIKRFLDRYLKGEE